ncbi:hypothetical protein A0H76_2376 [Hepatospora eriocheir]|uniref:Uncharacterized protein n=1 Tax=Hepatospora eriocheir TaxID=1081669 RepID=A0A1X0QLA3_9MICR|nr:hypothetical protein A0H76_2376 [Hepatospora eriocheir]
MTIKILLKLQELLKEYLHENELYRLKEVFKDNTVIYNKELFDEVERQEKEFKYIKEIFKKIQKKKKLLTDVEIDDDILKLIKELTDITIEEDSSKECEIKIVKNDLEWIKNLEEFKLIDRPINRNLAQSNTHMHHIGKQEENPTEQKITGTLINQSMVFQNGIPIPHDNQQNNVNYEQ